MAERERGINGEAAEKARSNKAKEERKRNTIVNATTYTPISIGIQQTAIGPNDLFAVTVTLSSNITVSETVVLTILGPTGSKYTNTYSQTATSQFVLFPNVQAAPISGLHTIQVAAPGALGTCIQTQINTTSWGPVACTQQLRRRSGTQPPKKDVD